MKDDSLLCLRKLWIIARIIQLYLSWKEGYAVLTEQKNPKITKQGWDLLRQFKYGSLEWVKLKDIKESNIIEVAEYAVTNHL